MSERPTWNEYFMKMAVLVSERSTCIRRQVGAVLVKNNQIITTGYNGVPKNISHCTKATCTRETQNIPSGEKHELCLAVHAEQNAIIQAAVNGTNILGAVLYSTTFPCSICAKMIINAEIKMIFILDTYPDPLAKRLFADAGVDVILFNPHDKSLQKIC